MKLTPLVKSLLAENTIDDKIKEVGADVFVETYLEWLEDLLSDLEDDGDIEAIKRFDTVLNARFALKDSDIDNIMQYMKRKYSNKADDVILRILKDIK
jgi:hypothetical protein